MHGCALLKKSRSWLNQDLLFFNSLNNNNNSIREYDNTTLPITGAHKKTAPVKNDRSGELYLLTHRK
ncbi:hypothetical protein B0I18_103371 [Taibaiella chishuiensis]|uniref:Uncharacterized protein n=1 Tax=Taibaiella chishuiensis TaxID=1434707 RepID=A0A2P8D6F2_9BACT|nr:hypothetical protein B0I18_103371 [Taibaiella chishuiensis]